MSSHKKDKVDPEAVTTAKIYLYQALWHHPHPLSEFNHSNLFDASPFIYGLKERLSVRKSKRHTTTLTKIHNKRARHAIKRYLM